MVKTRLDSVLAVGGSMSVCFPCLSKGFQLEGHVDTGVDILDRRSKNNRSIETLKKIWR